MKKLDRLLLAPLPSLRSKFLLGFVILSIFPIVFISLVGYQLTRNIILNQTTNYLALQTEIARKTIFQFLQETRAELAPFNAGNLAMYRHLAQQLAQNAEPSLTRDPLLRPWLYHIQRSEYFTNIWIVNRDLKPLFSKTADPLPLPRQWFEHLPPDTLLVLPFKGTAAESFFYCTHAIVDARGNLQGYVIGNINQKELLRRLQPGKNGTLPTEVFLLRAPDEILLCNSSNPEALAPLPSPPSSPSSATRLVTLPDGREMIQHHTPLGLFNWTVMAQVPYHQAMAPVIRFRNQAIIGVGLLLLLIIGSALYLSRLLTIPLKELTESAHKIGEGHLDTPVPRLTRDEIGQLAQAFDEMRLRLKDSYEHLEERVQQRTEELRKAQFQIMHQEKMASLGLLAAGIAHEIGNPLTSISSLIQLLKRRAQDEKTREYLNTVLEHINRISSIVRELVDFSRPRSEEEQPTDINQVIQSAVGIVRFDKRAKKIHLDVHLDPNLPTLTLVPDQLQQVVLNILMNALDAMEQKGDRLRVHSYSRNQQVFIEIEDTGVGIPEEQVSRIFEPFFTTKPVGKGTGLGLTVSYGIIQKFGGDILVESREGQGTRFTIVLPVNPKGDEA